MECLHAASPSLRRLGRPCCTTRARNRLTVAQQAHAIRGSV
jgi:hypothetical protein